MRPRQKKPTAPRESSVHLDPEEVAKFSNLAAQWWDPEGPMRPLHVMNPARSRFLIARLSDHFGLTDKKIKILEGLSLCDIGCGGGFMSEAFARLGARVTGLDASGEALAVARTHAEAAGLAIDYRETQPEALAKTGVQFDAVLCLELLEHVVKPADFVIEAARLVRPGGLFIASTLNRTWKAYLLAILGAEYLLRWLPRGTHNWQKFVTPAELARWCERAGLVPQEITGFVYDPFMGTWQPSEKDLAVNYFLVAKKPA